MTPKRKTTKPAKPGPTKPARHESEVIPKRRLAEEIRRVIAEKELSQTAAAAVAQEAQSQMSLIMSDRLDGFSATRLIRVLLRLGRDVHIGIAKTTDRRWVGRVRVTSGGTPGRRRRRRA